MAPRVESAAVVTPRLRILLISGSTRGGSTNTAALRTAAAAAPEGVDAVLFDGLAQLPAFNPDDDHEPPPPGVADLHRQISAADAVVFCTPEYAGALPGSFKNLLDWTVGSGQLYGKPVAWLNVAAEGRGIGAYASLATVLGYVGAQILGDACLRLPVARQLVDADGLVRDPDVSARIAHALRVVVREVGRQPRQQLFPALRQVVLDTRDVRALAEFYRQLLGLQYRAGDEPPPAGEPDPCGEDWLVLQDVTGTPRLAFQQVAELPEATWPSGPHPQMLHLDLTVPTPAELAAQHDRVLALGARLLHDRSDDPEEPLRVYADPAGHPFCIFATGSPTG